MKKITPWWRGRAPSNYGRSSRAIDWYYAFGPQFMKEIEAMAKAKTKPAAAASTDKVAPLKPGRPTPKAAAKKSKKRK